MYLEDHCKPFEQIGSEQQNAEAVHQQLKGLSNSKRINYTCKTIHLGVQLCNSSSIHNIEYSNKYGVVLLAADNKVLVKTTDELDSDFQNQKHSSKEQLSISFSGELFLSPDEETLAICSESLMQFIKISSLEKHNNIQAPPIPNFSEANHYLWVDNTHFLCWKFLGVATLYTINPKTLSLVGDQEQLQMEEVTGASAIHDHLFLISKIKIKIFELINDEIKLKSQIDITNPHHQVPYFKQSFIIDIFKINIKDQKFTESDTFGIIAAFYDVKSNASVQRFLTFAKGNIFNLQSLEIKGYEKLQSALISKDFFYNDDQKLGFSVKRIIKNGIIYIALEKSQKLYALNSLCNFGHLSVQEINITDESEQEIIFLSGICLMKNTMENKNIISYKETQIVEKNRRQQREYIAQKSINVFKRRQGDSILVAKADKLSNIYKISWNEDIKDKQNQKAIQRPKCEKSSQKEVTKIENKVAKKQEKIEQKNENKATNDPKNEKAQKQSEFMIQNQNQNKNIDHSSSINLFRKTPQSSIFAPKTIDNLFKKDAIDTMKPQVPLINTAGGGINIFAKPPSSNIFDLIENSQTNLNESHSVLQIPSEKSNIFNSKLTNINVTSQNDINYQTNNNTLIADFHIVGNTKQSPIQKSISAPVDRLTNWISQVSQRDAKVKKQQSSIIRQQYKQLFPALDNPFTLQKSNNQLILEKEQRYAENQQKKTQNNLTPLFQFPERSATSLSEKKNQLNMFKSPKITFNLNQIHDKLHNILRWHKFRLNEIQVQKSKHDSLTSKQKSEGQYFSLLLIRSKLQEFEMSHFSNVMNEFARKTQHANFLHNQQAVQKEHLKKIDKYREISNKMLYYSSLLRQKKILRVSIKNQFNMKNKDILKRLIHQNEEKIQNLKKQYETFSKNTNEQDSKVVSLANTFTENPKYHKTLRQQSREEIEYTIVQHISINNIPIIRLPNVLRQQKKTIDFSKSESKLNLSSHNDKDTKDNAHSLKPVQMAKQAQSFILAASLFRASLFKPAKQVQSSVPVTSLFDANPFKPAKQAQSSIPSASLFDTNPFKPAKQSQSSVPSAISLSSLILSCSSNEQESFFKTKGSNFGGNYINTNTANIFDSNVKAFSNIEK